MSNEHTPPAEDAASKPPESAPRAAPQYGEYATPEEQQARIQQPNATWALQSGQAVDAPPPAAPVEPETLRESQNATDAAVIVPSRGRVIDRVTTFALLGYGLFTVVTSIPALTDYGTYAQTLFSVMGADAQLSDPASGRAWGLAAALVLGLGWLLTAVLSWVNLRARRVTWWIPIVGALVFNLIAAVLMMVPIINDPTVWDALISSVV